MSVATKAVRGMAWTISTSVASRAIGLVGTLILVHFMPPEPYGVAQAAWVLVATAQQFSTLGVGLYVVKNPTAGRDVVFHATLIHLVIGAFALAAVVALRNPLGPIFDAPTLGAYVPLLALAAFIDRVSFMPEKVLVKELRFRQASLARTTGELAYTGVSVLLAMRGWGAWSLVWGNVARSAVRLVFMAAAVSWREWFEPHEIKLDTLRTLLSFGLLVAVAGVAYFASRRWDNLLVARLFGPEVLGAYTLAYNLADVPAIQVGEQITDVFMASLAHLEEADRKRALVRTIGLLALIMFPMAAGLGSVAASVAHTFLTHAWDGVAPMLAILSILSAPRPITLACSSYLIVRDQQALNVKLECANVALLMTLIVVLGRYSPYAACFAVGISFTLRALATIWVIKRLDGMTMGTYLGQMVGPVLACAPMVGAVALTHLLLGRVRFGSAVNLALEMLVGVAVYIPAALIFARASSLELLRLVRRALHREPQAA